MSTEQLIQNLQNATIFDHPVKKFKVLETHISYVILTGEFAYKIKKPVDFEFLNYSTLEKRKFYCEEEMRLNTLSAPELYVGLVKITGSVAQPQINGSGPVIEYALKMREFTQDSLFTELLAQQKITPFLIDKLAQLIAEFHLRTTIAAADSVFGTPEHVQAPVIQNFDQILPLLTEETDVQQLAVLRQWAEQQYVTHYKLLQQRKAQGFIRDCHGDLHLGNIILYQGAPLLFDRIEFNEDFRWTDVIADIGFLVMDLQEHQQPVLAQRLINTYLIHTGDYAGLALLPFYVAYRAVVRAKITLFGLFQPDLKAAEKAAIFAKYRKFMAIAEYYTHPTKPALIITHGLARSGKSTLVRLVVEQLGAIQIDSDIERKRLFGLPLTAKTYSDVNSGIYNFDATQKTYMHLATVVSIIIQAGYTAIVDASFIKAAYRDLFSELAQKLEVPFVILNCQIAYSKLKERITTGVRADSDPSEAYLAVLEMQQTSQETLRDEERYYSIDINMLDFDAEKLGAQISKKLRNLKEPA